MNKYQNQSDGITVRQKFDEMEKRIQLLEADLIGFKEKSENEVINLVHAEDYGKLLARFEKVEKNVKDHLPEDKLSIVIFSNEFDKLVAAFIIATGAAAMGTEVVMFFTFWGLNALTKKASNKGKTFIARLFGFMLPRGTKEAKTSHFNLAGLGPKLFRHLMDKGGVASLEELMEMVKDLDVHIKTCEMSKALLGIKEEEMIGDFETVGVATFLNDAYKSKVTLFI